jgi:hypothetical protein
MGCDIHPAIEYRESEVGPWKALLAKDPYFGKREWHDKEYTASLDIGRDYDLFAILGNVRNNRGFAGEKTGERFAPMSDCRGVPDDISPEARDVLSNEHSATWVTLAEILAYDWDRTSTHRGCVNPAEFAKWDRTKNRPDSWSGGVAGRGVRIVSNDEMRQAIADDPALKDDGGLFCKSGLYTWIEWESTYSRDGDQLWHRALPKMLNLGRSYGLENVRLVMDFDS